MKSNRTSSLKVSCFAVGIGTVELETGLALHYNFGEIRTSIAPFAVNIFRGRKPIEIPSEVLMDHRGKANPKTVKKSVIHADSMFESAPTRLSEG